MNDAATLPFQAVGHRWLRGCVAVWLAGSMAVASGATQVPEAVAAATALRSVADAVLAWRTEHDTGMRLLQGLPITALPDLGERAEQRDADEARRQLVRLAGVDRTALTGPEQLFRDSLAHDLETTADAAQYYWLNFAITPYRGGDIHQLAYQVLAAQALPNAAACQRYARLVRDYGRVLEEIRAKTLGQRQRGILLSRDAVPGARRLVDGLSSSAAARIVPDDTRLAALDDGARARCRAAVEREVQRRILPGYARLLATLDDDYLRAGPEAVGLAQYPKGREYYRHLIRAYTGLDLSATDIHALGAQRLEEFAARKAAIRRQVGFAGTREEFDESLRSDPRWIAATPADIEARFQGYLRLIEPHIPELFSRQPAAPYGVKRLDEADEPGMTYGFYQSPTTNSPTGWYRYNGAHPERRTLIGAQHLIYHELVPGHHFQLGLQRERPDVHPLQAYLHSGAYVEGWAEYAASLAEDLGLYAPYDLYGHLLMQSHLAARLVLDTGMNELGWSLPRARACLAEHTLLSPEEIDSETLRYATDIPGQALGYFLGYQRMRELRERAIAALGPAFDARAFNDALLATGAVPLNVLDASVDAFIAAHRPAAAAKPTHFAGYNGTALDIAAPPAVVWRELQARSDWNSSIVGKSLLQGTEYATGELAIYTLQSAAGQRGSRLEEILLAVPEQRLVIRLAPVSDDATFAFADFRLSGTATGTRLEMNLYWTDAAEGARGSAQLEATRQHYLEATGAKISGDLARLKTRAEAAATARRP